MNRENMLRVADAIEQENIARFDMRSWVTVNTCGTVACVAGFAALIEPNSRLRMSHSGKGQEVLGLDDYEAQELFYGGAYDLAWLTMQKKLVPDALRWMALTGEVDWRKGLNAAKCVKENRARTK